MKLRNVSASQVSSFSRCNRKWFFRYVMRIIKPQQPYQKRGTDIHKTIENYLKFNKAAPNEHAPYLQAALAAERRDGRKVLPHPVDDRDRFLCEHGFRMETGTGLPVWVGYIDVLALNPNEIGDFKTTSNLRYAKTPEELRSDTQMTSYGRFALTEGHKGPLDLWHLYIETKAKNGVLTPPKKTLPRTKFVPVTLTPETIKECWERDVETVAQMVNVATTKTSHHDVTPNTLACNDYGGCEYRDECGIADLSVGFSSTQNKKKEELISMSSVLERLKAKANGTNGATAVAKPAAVATVKAAPAAPAPVAEKAAPREMPAFLKAKLAKSKEAASVPTGIVPEDAPDRTTPVEEAATEVEDTVEVAEEKPTTKRKAGRPKKTKTEKVEEMLGSDAAEDGLHLYIDCLPVKGSGPVVMFEDWSAPIIHTINETVAAEKGLHHYLQLGYSDEKAALVMAFTSAMESVPPVLVVNSSMLGAKEALNVLIPHAKRVVRALRN